MIDRLGFLIGPLIATLAMLAIPHITRRDLLFGVPVPEGFRSTAPGRRALHEYRVWIAIPAILSFLALVLLGKPLLGKPLLGQPVWMPFATLSIVAIGLASFVAQNRKLKPYAIQPPLIRQTTLDPSEPLPWFTWLGIPPLLLLAASALYLHAHWDQIPERFPIHYDITGTPNRWAERTVRGVYGPLILGGEITLLMFVFAIAGWYGSRRSEGMRKPAMAVLLSVEWAIALTFGLLPLKLTATVPVPILLIVLGPMLLIVPAMIYAYNESVKPRGPLDPTPNECWKGGIIYYNPNDAALFVQRRDGIGFTINMANRWSWAIYGSLLLVLLSTRFIVH